MGIVSYPKFPKTTGSSHWLPNDEVSVIMKSKNSNKVVISGQTHINDKLLYLIMGDASVLHIPLGAFQPTASATPDFYDFQILDMGLAIRFGDYEVEVSDLLAYPRFGGSSLFA